MNCDSVVSPDSEDGNGADIFKAEPGAADPEAASWVENSPIHLLHRAGQCAAEVFAKELPPGLLTPRQYAVLLTVARHEGLSQTELVERTGIDRSTLADIVRRMIDKDILERQRTKTDARAYSVNLTAKGRDILAQVGPISAQIDRQILGALPPGSRQMFVTMLERLVSSLAEPDVDPDMPENS